jgi:hypothetical protein
MFNISQVGKILKATNRLNMPTEFNASLPITIEVKKQINPIRYILKLGKKEVETKSYTPLEIGGKYKAQINQTDNKIEIKNLKKLPQIFTKFPDSINYSIDDLIKDEPFKSPEKYKQFLLNHLANSNNQQEFLFFTQLLLATNQNVYHLFINDEKKSLIQLKPKKKKLKFYGFFENLGGIGGEIYLIDEIYLDLMVEFHNSLYLIEKHLSDLKGIIINSIKQENLTPLFEISGENILNLKA